MDAIRVLLMKVSIEYRRPVFVDGDHHWSLNPCSDHYEMMWSSIHPYCRSFLNLSGVLGEITRRSSEYGVNGTGGWSVRIAMHSEVTRPCSLNRLLGAADLFLTSHGFQSTGEIDRWSCSVFIGSLISWHHDQTMIESRALSVAMLILQCWYFNADTSTCTTYILLHYSPHVPEGGCTHYRGVPLQILPGELLPVSPSVRGSSSVDTEPGAGIIQYFQEILDLSLQYGRALVAIHFTGSVHGRHNVSFLRQEQRYRYAGQPHPFSPPNDAWNRISTQSEARVFVNNNHVQYDICCNLYSIFLIRFACATHGSIVEIPKYYSNVYTHSF